MQKPILRIFASLCFLSILATGHAITCYVCNSYFDNNCRDLGTGNSTGLLRDCDKEPIFTNHTEVPKNYTICRKMIVTLPGEDRPRIVRSCSWIKHTRDCYHTSTMDVKSTVCQCYDTGCNGASPLKNTWIAVLLSFGLVLLLSR